MRSDKYSFMDALKLDKNQKKLHLFTDKFPEFGNSAWTKEIVNKYNKAS